MRYLFFFVLASLLVIAPAFCLELTVNGAFEEPLTTGWDELVGASNYSITRSTHYDPDGDYEARVNQTTGTGYVRLFQMVPIPSTDIDFSANLKLYAWDNSASAWGGAALIIGYHDAFENLLGETFICGFSDNCPWTNSSTRHLITASDSAWYPYAFNIATELSSNLPGVNAADVKQIKVSLYTQIYHC